ncbi:MAG: permease [Defluviitaleaceae bacterium]|nr:permease [Defluviitaleaceae bacterium]
MDILMREIYMLSNSILSQLRMISPYWIVGLVAGSLVSVYLSSRIASKVAKLSAERLWVICLASFLGIASPLCMFGTVPLIAALGQKGVPQHVLASFMVSSVLLNPNLWLVSFVLGLEIALTRLVLAFLCGVLAGLAVLYFFKGKDLFSFGQFSNKKKKRAFLPDLAKAFRITTPYLIMGVTLTALGERYIPPEWIAGMFGTRRGLGVLFATTLSVPLYICGAGTIPLIRAWLVAGMGTGDALAFMLAGPATKLNNLSAVKMILGTKHFLLYLAFVVCFAVLTGWIIGFFM